MKFPLRYLVAVFASWSLLWMPASATVDIGLNKQLLVDDYVIARMRNLKRRVGQAKKHGVVLTPTLPTDFQSGHVHEGPDGGPGYEFGESTFCWFFSPHWDPHHQTFRLWYMASKRPGSALAYAESRDGINWTKPLIANDGKSNLIRWNSKLPILRDGRDKNLLDHGLDGVTVTLDPRLPVGHAEKYKLGLFPNVGGGDCRTRLAYSANGIQWNFYNRGAPVTGRAADFSNQIVWDPGRQKYLLLCREDFAAGGGLGELRGVRIMEHAQGNDLLQHPTAWKTLTKFVLNDPDPNQVPGTNIPERQIHTFPIWYYEGIWFGLTDVLTATNRPVAIGQQDYHTRHDKGVWEFYLSPSRDAINYDFEIATYPQIPLIPRGSDGAFDKDCVRPPTNIITYQDQHWIYYLGTNERWGARKWDARLGLARIRLDGFFYLQANDPWGQLTTKPFRLLGETLEVNVNATHGEFFVEVLDEQNQSLNQADLQFGVHHAQRYANLDALRLRPRWQGGRDLSPLVGRTIRLRFHLRNASLYAFQITQSNP